MQIQKAWCVELNEVITIARARDEFLKQASPARFTFLCSDEKCRNSLPKGVRVEGVNYTKQAMQRFRVDHFRKLDQHIADCVWVLENDRVLKEHGSKESSARVREPIIKLSSGVTGFSIASKVAPNTARFNAELDETDFAVKKRGTKPATAPDPIGCTQSEHTHSFSKFIFTYLERKAKGASAYYELTSDFLGQSGIRWSDTCNKVDKQLQYPERTQRQRITFGGARLDKRDGIGFVLKFYDGAANQEPIYWHVTEEKINNFRYRKQLLQTIDKLERKEIRYVTLFGIGVTTKWTEKPECWHFVEDEMLHVYLVEVISKKTTEGINA